MSDQVPVVKRGPLVIEIRGREGSKKQPNLAVLAEALHLEGTLAGNMLHTHTDNCQTAINLMGGIPIIRLDLPEEAASSEA